MGTQDLTGSGTITLNKCIIKIWPILQSFPQRSAGEKKKKGIRLIFGVMSPHEIRQRVGPLPSAQARVSNPFFAVLYLQLGEHYL